MERQARLPAMVHLLGRPYCRKSQYLPRLCIASGISCSDGRSLQAAPTRHRPQHHATLRHVHCRHSGNSWALELQSHHKGRWRIQSGIQHGSKRYLFALFHQVYLRFISSNNAGRESKRGGMRLYPVEILPGRLAHRATKTSEEADSEGFYPIPQSWAVVSTGGATNST